MLRARKRLLIVAVLVLAAFVLIPIFRKKDGIPPALKPLSYPYDTLSSIMSSLSDGISRVINAAEENKRLKAELQATLPDRQRCGEIVKENQRLHELLSLKQRVQGGGIAAHVVGRGYDKFINTLVINKGSNEGINKDMSAITPQGLAGKVYAVRKDYSDIMLLRDPNFSVAVRLQESRHEGVLTGTGQRYCILKYVPTENPVKEGEIVVTSGLDGFFPEGLPVGRVTKVLTEGVEFFQYIEVVPFQASGKIEEVLVVGRSAELQRSPEVITPPTATADEKGK
jgi:rod shape-determining protein MreC